MKGVYSPLQYSIISVIFILKYYSHSFRFQIYQNTNIKNVLEESWEILL